MEEMKKGLEEIRDQISDQVFTGELVAEELLHSINPVLDNPGELSFEYHRALLKSLTDAVEAFEIRHPRLVDEIRVVINALNDLGI